jgi:NDP-sugar pyrophosphorylase family protein
MDALSLDESLIANGDTFLGGSLGELLTPLRVSTGELMRVAVVAVPNRERFGGVEVDAEGHITAFLEKGRPEHGTINAGLYRLHRMAFVGQPLGVLSLESQVMPDLVDRRALTACHLSGPFVDIGVPEDYRLFDSNVLDYVRHG